MRHAASVRPARPITSGFTKLFTFEELILDTLPLWQYRLFSLLVRLSRYSTGVGVASIADLVQAMTPIQPRSGPKHYVPNGQAIYKAVVGFEDRHILARDKRRSQSEKVIHYLLAPRNAKPRPTPELEGQTRRAVDKRKASNGAAYSVS